MTQQNMARVQQKFRRNRERKTMISHPFHFALEPKIFIRLFLAVLVLHHHGADAVRTRCKTTKDCVDPENVQFCDENFFACMPCADYCTGAEDAKPNCREKCPIRYTAVYTASKVVVPQVELTPPKEPAPVSQNTKETGVNYSTVIAVVIGCVLLVVLVVVGAFGLYNLRCKKQDSRNGHDHDDPEKAATDKLMDGEHGKDEKPDKMEEKTDNGKGKPENIETENEDAKTEQPDYQRPQTDALVCNSSDNLPLPGQLLPNPNFDAKDCEGINEEHTAVTSLQSMPHDKTTFRCQIPR